MNTMRFGRIGSEWILLFIHSLHNILNYIRISFLDNADFEKVYLDA
jgi:hypothetical protein